MTAGGLSWCEAPRGCACERNHALDLQQFACVEPAPRGVLPKHRAGAVPAYARQVQTGIRAIRPPVPPTDLLLLGYDDEGLAVVSHSFEMDGPSFVKILAAARAQRCRGRGYGDVILDETLNRLALRAGDAECESVLIQGYVHRENGLSQAMVERNNFFYYGDDGACQKWYLQIELDYTPPEID